MSGDGDGDTLSVAVGVSSSARYSPPADPPMKSAGNIIAAIASRIETHIIRFIFMTLPSLNLWHYFAAVLILMLSAY